jgi:hypothetical protein
MAEGERLAAAAPGARFVPVESAGHTFGAVHPWQGAPPALEQVEDMTLAFFAEHLV